MPKVREPQHTVPKQVETPSPKNNPSTFDTSLLEQLLKERSLHKSYNTILCNKGEQPRLPKARNNSVYLNPQNTIEIRAVSRAYAKSIEQHQ